MKKTSRTTHAHGLLKAMISIKEADVCAVATPSVTILAFFPNAPRIAPTLKFGTTEPTTTPELAIVVVV
jgi:hypothetical protein